MKDLTADCCEVVIFPVTVPVATTTTSLKQLGPHHGAQRRNVRVDWLERRDSHGCWVVVVGKRRHGGELIRLRTVTPM